MDNPKNILVQYEGGGYDGCFWEYNYFLFNADGVWHNLHSTGRQGCKTVEDAERVLRLMENRTYVYDITDESHIDKFQLKTNEGHVVAVTNKVNEILGCKVMWFICDNCGDKVYSGFPSCPCGAGGIAIEMREKLCETCMCEKDGD